MPTQEESKVSYNEARNRILALEKRLQDAKPEDDLDALDTEFTEAREAMEAAEKQLARFTAIAEARAANPILTQDTPDDDKPEAEKREKTGPEMRAALNDGGRVRVTEALTYRWDNCHEVSFFQDLWAVGADPQGRGKAASERLNKHQKETYDLRRLAGVHERAMSSTAGVGGELVTPIYLNDQFVPVARVGRPFVNAVGTSPLPPNTNSINIPRLSTGTSEAAQQDGGAVSSTDAVTNYLTIPVNTIAGQVDVSRQLLERATPGLDQILFPDLIAAQNAEFDRECVNGSGAGGQIKGVLTATSPLTLTYTQASPVYTSATPGVGLYGRIVDATYKQIATNLFRQADYTLMHPRRWGWIVASLDTATRPIIGFSGAVMNDGGPEGDAFNPGGILSNLQAQGVAGVILGLPVIIDANVPVTQGDGTRDQVVVGRSAEYLIWEDNAGPYLKVFEQTLSGTLQVRLQAYTYVAATFERYNNANCIISGSGLTTPVYN